MCKWAKFDYMLPRYLISLCIYAPQSKAEETKQVVQFWQSWAEAEAEACTLLCLKQRKGKEGLSIGSFQPHYLQPYASSGSTDSTTS